MEQAVDCNQFQFFVASVFGADTLTAGLPDLHFQGTSLLKPAALRVSTAQSRDRGQCFRSLSLLALGIGFPVQRAIGATSFQLDDIVKQLLCPIPAALV